MYRLQPFDGLQVRETQSAAFRQEAAAVDPEGDDGLGFGGSPCSFTPRSRICLASRELRVTITTWCESRFTGGDIGGNEGFLACKRAKRFAWSFVGGAGAIPCAEHSVR